MSARSPLVVHLIQHLSMGGMENGVVNLINRTPRGRVRHAVVCLSHFSDFRRRIEAADVPVIALDKKPGKDPRALLQLWRALRELRPDIVHARNLPTVDCAPVSKAAGVPLHLHGEHGWDMHDLRGGNPKYVRYRRWMRPFVDRYVAVSRDIERWLTASIGAAPGRVTQIYNGVDTARFHPRDAGTARDADTVTVGWLGRMQAVKDPVTLARAFARVAAHAPAGRRVRLVMIGEGPLHDEVRRVLAEAGIAELAWLPGARDDVPALLRDLDLFVLPSLSEGISNSILEAMASGLPVVATAVGGNVELVVPGETGELVPPQDVESMSVAIARYVSEPTRLAAHGRAARARAVGTFSLDGMVERYLSLYESLLAAGARGGLRPYRMRRCAE
jgi:sugar transferase (PEP-CTERM/EpsH1 system associated)